MDPEGLVMAQKLLDLAPQYSQIVGMNEKNYHQFGTESGADLSIRLKQLRQLKDDKLKRFISISESHEAHSRTITEIPLGITTRWAFSPLMRL